MATLVNNNVLVFKHHLFIQPLPLLQLLSGSKAKLANYINHVVVILVNKSVTN